MKIDIVSIFPDYLSPLRLSLVGRAIENGTIELDVHDLRDYTHDRHHTVDDSPYGGGPGMVMKPEPWGEQLDALMATRQQTPRLVVPTPSGKPFTQAMAHQYAIEPWLIFACARYEGIDQRVMDHYATVCAVDEVSVGDYVLAGGEAAVLVMVEAVARLVPGVLGNAQSAPDDSFALDRPSGAELEGPVYTKPASWRGLEVPEVLRSGDHEAVARWRSEQSVLRTASRRPDLAP